MASPQSGSSTPPPGRTQAPPKYSSAAFLHHLHTDPSSHHVSLTAPAVRQPSIPEQQAASDLRASDSKLLAENTEPGSALLDRPMLPTRRSSAGMARTLVKQASTPGLVDSPLTMPGSSTIPALRRTGSKRGRPMTAPGGSPGELLPSSLSSVGSPDTPADRLEDPPFIPAQEEHLRGPDVEEGNDDAMEGGMDECGFDGGADELGQAIDMMEISGSRRRRRGPTRIFGRADDASERRIEQGASSTAQQVRDPSRLQSDPSPTKVFSRAPTPDLDWKTFGQAYAYGNFDPNKIPHPPRSSYSPAAIPTARSSPGEGYSNLFARRSGTDTSSSASASTGPFSQASGSSGSNTTFTSAESAPTAPIGPTLGKTQSSSSVPTHGVMSGALAGRQRAFELESIAARRSEQSKLKPDQLSLPSYSFAAATVRMAASHIDQADLAPLGVPSPDRELMDPMASMFSPTSASTLRESASSDPGGSRLFLNRSMSSTAVPRDRDALQLPTIAASPAGTPLEHPSHGKGKGKPDIELPRRTTSPAPPTQRLLGPGGIVSQRIPPATAPVEKTLEAENEEDYFGTAVSPLFDRQTSYQSQSSSSNQTVTQQATPMTRAKTPEGLTSLPTSDDSPQRSPPPALAQPSDLGPLYEKYGWLAAPIPPDEIARRKALYRFNILHTSADVNFDRIAHMAKLVFNTKIVIISLTDAETQWHKTDMGLGSATASRISSFCSHTLLLKTGEPLVVLDTLQDWRFVNNPNVTSGPGIRFYAGAPLRTTDGYNLGTLCVIDDKPRTEFPPRSRLILKEFAAVCMREMELWRDKLQLRVRDKIQTSMEKFTRECLEMDARSTSSSEASARMDQVYARAAQLVCTTLDLDGCFILDVSHFELVEVETDKGKKSVYRADPYTAGDQASVFEFNESFGPINALPVLGATPTPASTRPLTAEEHQKMSDFLLHHRDGRIFENVAPSWIRYMFPPELRYGMVVPCYGVHQQPFALIAGYTIKKSKQYLEGYELQFLRAIGVIILSAVLRRRMLLADKTKSILISSVSHELRTPLHGILAAAELLSDTELDSNQQAFLKTVQTCGNTLIETVNHVLDFTKLSGSGSATKDGSIKLAKINLANLVEQTVEGVWIGQRARFFMGDSDIGSFYAPPPSTAHDRASRMLKDVTHVETVVDIGHRDKGWMVRCERGGLRRVLMNLVGNSLKFTTDGYIQVTLRELPHPPGAKTIPVEMAVIDTGKGIGKEFLKDQLFQPFSQENPLQTGTGLGLAIVNSIIRSDSVNGKVDVWSSEGLGTEIRISFEVEVYDEEEDSSSSSGMSAVSSASSGFGRGHSVAMSGFNTKHRGQVLALEVLTTYAATWSFDLRDDGDIIVINEDEDAFRSASNEDRPIIFITSTQTPSLMHLRDSIKRSGNFVQVIHKPVAPSPFRGALHAAVEWLEQRDGGSTPVSELDRPGISRGESNESASTISELNHRRDFLAQSAGIAGSSKKADRQPLYRRRSEEQDLTMSTPSRPSMAPRGITFHTAPVRPTFSRRTASISDETDSNSNSPQPGSPTSSTSHISHISTISLADGGVMLKTAQLPASAPRPGRSARVLVVEDNVINRRVLGAFLKKRGFEYAEAHDGRDGVDVFDNTPHNHFDVILMDITMPNMNGHQATRAIRKIEAARRSGRPAETPMLPEPGQPITLAPPKIIQSRVKIFALTGLATADDKREAFGSGVDGYLVKPVSLASLDVVFKKLGY